MKIVKISPPSYQADIPTAIPTLDFTLYLSLRHAFRRAKWKKRKDLLHSVYAVQIKSKDESILLE